MSDPSNRTTGKPFVSWACVLVMPTYKPGDLPPEGYLQWHEWAEVQRKAGIKQVQCPTCSLWRTPQELSTHMLSWQVLDRRGRRHTLSEFECSKCFAKREVVSAA